MSEIQAQAILDMQAQQDCRVWKERRSKTEYQELLKKIAYYNELLADEHKLMGVVRDELTRDQGKMGRQAKNQDQIARESEIDEEDLIEEEQVCSHAYTPWLYQACSWSIPTSRRSAAARA